MNTAARAQSVTRKLPVGRLGKPRADWQSALWRVANPSQTASPPPPGLPLVDYFRRNGTLFVRCCAISEIPPPACNVAFREDLESARSTSEQRSHPRSTAYRPMSISSVPPVRRQADQEYAGKNTILGTVNHEHQDKSRRCHGAREKRQSN